MMMYPKVQYISQGNTASEQLNNIQSVLDKGFNWVQLRFKHQPENELIQVAEKVKLLCDIYQATFIMNDHVAIAKTLDASGVHLGLSDTSIAEAKMILGNDKIIGGTANTIADVLQRISENCDYIGLGPFRFTATKEKLSPILGLEGYQSIMETLKQQDQSIPVYAIGGIQFDDIQSLMDIGLQGVAVSGLLTHSTHLTQQSFTESSIEL